MFEVNTFASFMHKYTVSDFEKIATRETNDSIIDKGYSIKV